MTTPTLYDAYTGIGVPKKKALIGFLRQYSNVAWIKPEGIQKAVEYAVKETPSFGGFIVTVEKDHQILAALIVNKTGMQGYLAEHIIVMNAIMPEYMDSSIMHELLRKAYGVAKGDIAMIVNSYSTKNMELKNINVAAREMKIPLLSKVQ